MVKSGFSLYFTCWGGPFLTLGSGTSSARNKNLRPLLNRNIPPIDGKYGLRNHFWPLESGFLMRKSEKKGPNFFGRSGLILEFTYSESSHHIRQLGWNRIFGSFFDLICLQDPCVPLMSESGWDFEWGAGRPRNECSDVTHLMLVTTTRWFTRW